MLLVAACAQDAAQPSDAGPSLDLAVDECANAPPVAWANFAQGFFIENCQPCHATSTPERYGAPTGVVFDTLADTLRWADRVLARTVEAESMPPAGGVSPEDRELLGLWLRCGIDSAAVGTAEE